jgi:hypothetical protein
VCQRGVLAVAHVHRHGSVHRCRSQGDFTRETLNHEPLVVPPVALLHWPHPVLRELVATIPELVGEGRRDRCNNRESDNSRAH